jgi:hypothetical protein
LRRTEREREREKFENSITNRVDALLVKLLLTLPNKENLTLDVAVEIKLISGRARASSAVKSMEIVLHSVTLVY